MEEPLPFPWDDLRPVELHTYQYTTDFEDDYVIGAGEGFYEYDRDTDTHAVLHEYSNQSGLQTHQVNLIGPEGLKLASAGYAAGGGLGIQHTFVWDLARRRLLVSRTHTESPIDNPNAPVATEYRGLSSEEMVWQGSETTSLDPETGAIVEITITRPFPRAAGPPGTAVAGTMLWESRVRFPEQGEPVTYGQMSYDSEGFPLRWVEDTDGDGVADVEDWFNVRLGPDGRPAELEVCPEGDCANGETTFFSYDTDTGYLLAAETRRNATGWATGSDRFYVWTEHPLGRGPVAQPISIYSGNEDLIRRAPCEVSWTVEEHRTYCPQRYETVMTYEGFNYPTLQDE